MALVNYVKGKVKKSIYEVVESKSFCVVKHMDF